MAEEDKMAEEKELTTEVADKEDAEMKAVEEDVAAEPKDGAKGKEPAKKELEEDAVSESRPKVPRGTVDINVQDATVNVMPTANNKVLMTLTEGGFQYLLAGVRTTVGVKAGRYMFEAKIVETHSGKGEGAGQQQQGQQGRVPQRIAVRIGLSVAGSSLLLADGSGGAVSFDCEGFFVHEKTRKRVSQKFGRDVTVALLVNLDPSSPNANTVSLFRDGVRCSEPQPIPEQLRGQALYPTITYKNVTVQVNLGPAPLRPLPFSCHMLSEAAAADVEVAVAQQPQDGKYEVLFPVGLPEAGYFDWVDSFLQQHPNYVELSDRKIVEWAVKSGLYKPRGTGHSTDKPDMKFGIPSMDDGSIRRLLSHIAPTACRNFIVPELAANLSAAERKEALSTFFPPEFRKTAAVLVGEPGPDFKAKTQELILADKKRQIEFEKKRKALEEERKRQLEERQKKAAAAKKKRLGGQDDMEDEVKEEEPKADDEEVVVELTEEEKALTFRKTAVPDITEAVVAKNYASFTLPTTAEGFDAVRYEWANEDGAAKVLKDWVFAKKLTQRVDDLQPGAAFKESWTAWQKSMGEWRRMASDWKDPSRRKALLAKRAEAKKKELEARKKEAEEKGEEPPKEEEKPAPINFDDLDVHGVEVVTDIGDGRPLFSDFAHEDWILLGARYEMHLLLHSFKKDLDDADRPSFTGKDLAFYYQKYFRKNFSLKTFDLEKIEDFAEMIRDIFSISEKTQFLEAGLGDDTPTASFVKLTEDHRRERQRRLDAGDESAELKFPRNQPEPPGRVPAARTGGGALGSSNRQPPSAGSRPAPHPPRSAPPMPEKRAFPTSYSSSAPPAKQSRTSSAGHYGSYQGNTGYGGYRRG